MGLQKDLEKAKKDLESIQKLIEKSDIAGAKKALEAVKTFLTTTAKTAEEKNKKGEEGIRKLAETLNAATAIADKKPFEGAKALALIKQASAAAVAAVQSASPAP